MQTVEQFIKVLQTSFKPSDTIEFMVGKEFFRLNDEVEFPIPEDFEYEIAEDTALIILEGIA